MVVQETTCCTCPTPETLLYCCGRHPFPCLSWTPTRRFICTQQNPPNQRVTSDFQRASTVPWLICTGSLDCTEVLLQLTSAHGPHVSPALHWHSANTTDYLAQSQVLLKWPTAYAPVHPAGIADAWRRLWFLWLNNAAWKQSSHTQRRQTYTGQTAKQPYLMQRLSPPGIRR